MSLGMTRAYSRGVATMRQMETQPMTSTSTSTMTIAEIHCLCEQRGVSPTDFWSHAMGGDRADLPREDVMRCMREILDEWDPRSHRR
jgi:hypothetical protein